MIEKFNNSRNSRLVRKYGWWYSVDASGFCWSKNRRWSVSRVIGIADCAVPTGGKVEYLYKRIGPDFPSWVAAYRWLIKMKGWNKKRR